MTAAYIIQSFSEQYIQKRSFRKFFFTYAFYIFLIVIDFLFQVFVNDRYNGTGTELLPCSFINFNFLRFCNRQYLSESAVFRYIGKIFVITISDSYTEACAPVIK